MRTPVASEHSRAVAGFAEAAQFRQRPPLEAIFYSRFFLEMACRYGAELKSPPELLPSDYATLLYLYDLR